MVFFLLHTGKFSHVCRGIKTSPIEGKYMLETSENSHIRSNLSEDLQQCTSYENPISGKLIFTALSGSVLTNRPTWQFFCNAISVVRLGPSMERLATVVTYTFLKPFQSP
jgi:hypothetical protein